MVLLFLYYDHVHIIVQPETSSYSLSYFAPIGHLDPKYLCSPILAFHLNCTKKAHIVLTVVDSKVQPTPYFG